MSGPLRVVIVGAGLMGRWHAHYVRKLGGKIVGFVDKDPQRISRLIDKNNGIRAFSELETCLASSDTDAVHICTPAESHVALASLALEAGAHLMIEKPIAPSHESTKALLDLAHRKRRLIAPVHQFPFQHGFVRLRDHVNSLGEPVLVRHEVYTAGGHAASESERRSILVGILPHSLSLGIALFGLPLLRTIQVIGKPTSDDLELFGTAGGASFQVSLSHRVRPTRNELTYFGSAGTGYVNLFHGFSVLQTGSETSRFRKAIQPFDFGVRLVTQTALNLSFRLMRSAWAYPGLYELIQAFYDSIRSGKTSPISEQEILEIAHTMDRVSAV